MSYSTAIEASSTNATTVCDSTCECNTCECSESTCCKTGYQYADISLPIQVKPNVVLGEIVTECCGEPTMTCIKTGCNDMCELKIEQRICIKIPVTYQVMTCVGETQINCGCSTPTPQ